MSNFCHNSILNLVQLSKTFARSTEPAVSHVSLSVASGEILALVGPSGCGKTTLLRMIAGFEQPQTGQIVIDGTDVTSQPPEARGIGMVFQDFALFPHLTGAQNVAFGLQGKTASTRQKIVQETLKLVGLLDFAQRYPHELSGGQQQRLALARAIAPDPVLILLDEPLSNLDAQIRWQLRIELRRILKIACKSAILVTHDQEEALHIADRVAVMRSGKLEQVDTPQALYQHPQTRFVAEFISQVNFLPATYHGGKWHTEIGDFYLPLLTTANGADPVELLVRPESLCISSDCDGCAVIYDRIFLGREVMYYLKTAHDQQLVVRSSAPSTPEDYLAVGTRVRATVPETAILCLAE